MLEDTLTYKELLEAFLREVVLFNSFVNDINTTKGIGMDEKCFIYDRNRLKLAGAIKLCGRLGLSIDIQYEDGRPVNQLELIESVRYRRQGQGWKVFSFEEQTRPKGETKATGRKGKGSRGFITVDA